MNHKELNTAYRRYIEFLETIIKSSLLETHKRDAVAYGRRLLDLNQLEKKVEDTMKKSERSRDAKGHYIKPANPTE